VNKENSGGVGRLNDDGTAGENRAWRASNISALAASASGMRIMRSGGEQAACIGRRRTAASGRRSSMAPRRLFAGIGL